MLGFAVGAGKTPANPSDGENAKRGRTRVGQCKSEKGQLEGAATSNSFEPSGGSNNNGIYAAAVTMSPDIPGM